MTFWAPRPERLIGAALASAGLFVAAPASALPLVDLGANVNAAAHLTNVGPALDLNASANVFGWVPSLQYWTAPGASRNYFQAMINHNVSPVPMLAISPGIGVADWTGAFGPLVSVTGSFSPFLVPLSVDAMVGAGYLPGSGALLPYYAGVKFTPLPFTALLLRYRGWTGATNVSGPEIGIEVGI